LIGLAHLKAFGARARYSVNTEMLRLTVLFLILLAIAEIAWSREKFTIQVNEGNISLTTKKIKIN